MSKRRITKEIKAELDRLCKASRTGRLHWEDVVQASKNKSSSLHSYFDWNAKAAMQAYLRQQAEELITGYYLTVINPVSGDKARTRAFISLSTDRANGGGYRGIMSVLSDEQLRAQMIEDALANLAAFKQRYKDLLELSALFDEIDKLERKHSKPSRPVRSSAVDHRAAA